MSDTNEEIVDRVLARLGKAEIPVNLEERVLAAIHSRAAAKPLPLGSSWKFALAAAGVTLAGAVSIMVAVHRPVSSRTTVPQRVAKTAPTPLDQPLKPFAIKAGVVKMTAKAKAQKAAPPRTSTSADEATAASFPAPPMPLTDQEKLLLRLAHKGDPVELAMLDPVQRAAQYADERAQVQRFFAPPKQEITSEP